MLPIVSLWAGMLWLVAYVHWRARVKAEARVIFWQDECQRVIQAQSLAEIRAINAEMALGKVSTAYKARIDQDRVMANIAHQARRLH